MFNRDNYETIRKEIPLNVKILAATKMKNEDEIRFAITSGITIIGENYVEEAAEKYENLKDMFKRKNIKFHLIGHLQSNKAKIAAEIFDCIETIDSIKIASRLNQYCEELNKKLDVFIEINFGEEQKAGITVNELEGLVESIKNLKNLNLLGLMTIPPLGKEIECFKQIKSLNDKYNLKELSMGMSSDYKVATECGSTLIRLGTALFGKRELLK